MSSQVRVETNTLGSPLPNLTQSSVSSNIASHADRERWLAHASQVLRPLLCRMYVASEILQLGIEARYAAIVYLYRYMEAKASASASTSTKVTTELPSGTVAAACLFLATKSQEEPRRLRDVINLDHMLFEKCSGTSSTNAQTEISSNNCVQISLDRPPPLLDEQYWEKKQQMIATEQKVLRFLGMDVFVPSPYRAVLWMVEQHKEALFFPCDRERFCQSSFQLLNDGLFDGRVLQHTVVELAVAVIEITRRERKRKRKQQRIQKQTRIRETNNNNNNNIETFIPNASTSSEDNVNGSGILEEHNDKDSHDTGEGCWWQIHQYHLSKDQVEQTITDICRSTKSLQQNMQHIMAQRT